MNRSYKLFTKQVGLVGIIKFIISFRGIILIPILTKTLVTFEYGIWSQILITIALLMPFATLGLGASMGRFISSEIDVKEIQEGFYSIFFTIICTGLLVSLLFFIISDHFASIIIKDISATSILKIAAFLILLASVNQILFTFFIATRKINRYSFFMILGNLLEIGFISYAVISDFGLFGAIIALMAAKLVLFIIMFLSIISKIGFKIPDFSKFKSYLLYGLPMVPNTMFAWIIHSSDQYMIGYFMGSDAVGIYSVAYAVGFTIKMLTVPISLILLPTVSKLWDENQIDEVKIYLKYSLRYFLMITIPSVFGLAILAKEIILILSSREFVSGAIIIPFVVCGLLFHGIYTIISKILTSALRTDLIAISLGIASAINIALNCILIPIYGILGAAIATLITYAFVGIFVSIISSRYLKLKFDWIFIIKSISASLIMAFILVKLDPTGILGMLTAIIICAIIYFITLYLLKGFNKQEKNILRSYIIRS